jgi:phosphocarrier protein
MDRQVTIKNKLGLHARPAMAFVDVATQFQSAIRVTNREQSVDGKSIMQMMLLAAGEGTPLRITAEGPDAAAALDALEKHIDGKFGEE